MATNVTDRLLSGNDFAVYVSKQTNKGAIDENPIFREWRRTDGVGRTNVTYTQSGFVRRSRQGRAQIKERTDYAAEISSELNKQSIDDLIADIHGIEEQIEVTSTGFEANETGFTSDAQFENINVGDYIWLTGFATEAINLPAYRVITKDDNSTIETYPAPPGIELTGAEVTMRSFRTVGGSAQTYYVLQTRTTDLSKDDDIDYHTLYDAIPNTSSIEIPESGIATYTRSMLAEKKHKSEAAVTGQTDEPGFMEDSVSAVQHIKDFFINGISQKCEVKSMSIEINNNYAQDYAAGCEGSRSAFGDIDISGSIAVRSMISNPFTFRNYYENATNVSIGALITHDGGGDTLILMRTCKITEATMPSGSGAISATEGSFSAQEDATYNTTIEIYRNWQ